MLKRNKNIKEGVVDLNQARLEANEKGRPSVAANKKVPNKNVQTKKSTSEKQQMPTISDKNKKINPIGNVNNFKNNNKTVFEKINNPKLLLTRRNLIFGAIGAGAILVGGTGIKFVTDTVKSNINTVDTLSVTKDKVISSDTLAESQEPHLTVANEITLPYGTLAWANSSNIISCLIPNDNSKPLTTVDIIEMSSGSRINILEKGVSNKEGYEIYDVRANKNGLIWTEVNILQNEWRIYASKFYNNYNIEPKLIDKGGHEWETPTIAINNNYVYWQVLPQANETKFKFLSSLKQVNIDNLNINDKYFANAVNISEDISNNPNVIYVSEGRMATPIYSYEEGVIISPRAKSKNIYYQLTYIDSEKNIIDKISLPQNIKPLEAGYGNTGFTFALDAIYTYGEGISNLGTYTPIKKSNNSYENLNWLNFSRNPTSPPAWCNDYFIVRSSMSVCSLDLENLNYSILDRPNASDDYGDYLASTGNCKKIVTYANVFEQPVSGDEKKYCLLRIWD